MKINTVTGPVDTSALGTTLIHEHINCADWSIRMNFGDGFFNFDTAVETAVAKLKKMKNECGITTIVDGTPINLGRDVKLIHEVAKRAGLNIIVSSGFYYQEEPGLMYLGEDDITELLLNECRNGIAGTGGISGNGKTTGTAILPGIMKTAVEKPEITPYLRKILGAVARVSAETGLPIFCHHNVNNKNGGEILDIFESKGAAPGKIILGHSGDTDDLSYLTEMLNRGCYIGMDRFGYCDMTLSLRRRAAAIAALCKKGYIGKMLLSHDLVVQGFFGSNAGKDKPEIHLPDFTFIHTTVRPELLAAGVTPAEFDTLMNDNPKRFFEGK
ncbi:MAG: hypothetical protein FWF29_01935 [Treponema sp.]|nr:hypothetical protein [Treponema sp.]